ncbi:MAG TPA: DUF6438 domain-containing protein [Chitinophagaceae bacterium]|nr:DUF6438 domain-containing protein [Chitinophagaceae bacterium]
MKRLARLALIAVIFSVSTDAEAQRNRIDSLGNDAEVLAFLKSVNKDFNSERFELRSTAALRRDLECNGMAESWQIKNWDRADFDGDGRNDLLIMPFWMDYGVYVIMDRGANRFETITLSYNIFDKCELARIADAGGRAALYYYLSPSRGRSRGDTLVYRHGGFVEYNATPAQKKIDSISFRTGYCFGSCPVFSIRLDAEGKAVYEAGAYNPKMGTYSATFSRSFLDELLALVHYVDPARLADDYKVSWAEDQTAWLRVRYADGSVKEIRDYGLKGNFGLRLLYSKFFEMRGSQPWK